MHATQLRYLSPEVLSQLLESRRVSRAQTVALNKRGINHPTQLRHTDANTLKEIIMQHGAQDDWKLVGICSTFIVFFTLFRHPQM